MVILVYTTISASYAGLIIVWYVMVRITVFLVRMPIFCKMAHVFYVISLTVMLVIRRIICAWSANQGIISTLDTACPTVLQIARTATPTAESAHSVNFFSLFPPTHAPPVISPTVCPAALLINVRNAIQDISSITKPTLAYVQIQH